MRDINLQLARGHTTQRDVILAPKNPFYVTLFLKPTATAISNVLNHIPRFQFGQKEQVAPPPTGETPMLMFYGMGT